MTKEEFEREWKAKIRDPFDRTCDRALCENHRLWHPFVLSRLHTLSVEAKMYIEASPWMGDWLKRELGLFSLEKALLEHSPD